MLKSIISRYPVVKLIPDKYAIVVDGQSITKRFALTLFLIIFAFGYLLSQSIVTIFKLSCRDDDKHKLPMRCDFHE